MSASGSTPSLDRSLTLRDNFYRTKQPQQKAAPLPARAKGPSYTAPTPDPLAAWINRAVFVTFISGRTLSGRLVRAHRYDLEVDSGGIHIIPKHAVEHVSLEEAAE